jgi:hypothetical protein
MAMSDLDECTVTFEQTQRKLDDIERRLAKELGIVTGIRKALLARAFEGELQDSSLAAEWHQTYASYLDWMAEEAEEHPHHEVIDDPPPTPTKKGDKPTEGAADAASLLLCAVARRSSNRVPSDAATPETAAISRSLLSGTHFGN